MAAQKEVIEANVVIVDWVDLISEPASPEIARRLDQAYGITGTGILAIRGVPGFVEAKNSFLPDAHNQVFCSVFSSKSPSAWHSSLWIVNQEL